MRHRVLCFFALAAAIALISTPAALAVDLFAEDFDIDPTANWTLNGGPSDEAADYFFDYDTVGIPSAPNSSGGSTRGLKMQANMTGAVFSGMSTSPTGESFSGDYFVTYDWWANFNGPFPVGGSGSTQLSTFGIGTAGTTAQWPGGVQDSVWFGGTGDGNSSVDWRAYSTAATTGYLPASGVFAAGTGTSPDARNHLHPYYASFGNNTAPATQVTLYGQQTGTTLVGSAAMEWHQAQIKKLGTTATWTVDGTLIATIDLTTVTMSGANIFFGHSDTNATSSADPNAGALLFTLIDNVRVVPIDPDFNNDTAVNAADYVLWREHEGLTGTATNADGDADGDQDVDQQDIDLWRATFGNPVPGAAALQSGAVPEPSTMLLVALGLAGLAVRRPKRSASGRSG